MTQKTFTPKKPAKADKKWFIVDASGQVVGRLATKIATVLRGKNKPSFAPNVDMGDYVVVINCDKIRLTGNKELQKEYIHHSGYLGHLKREPFATVKEKQPKRILTEAVAGMVPRNRLKKHVMAKLHVYAGEKHPHAGQNPVELTL
ncbi:50S ribosomal protein L13 [Candidatus Peregrinibacteria bacterium]|nr:50S ribosomal protein L13 [Candidatus Peregrinibacteria bacterium]